MSINATVDSFPDDTLLYIQIIIDGAVVDRVDLEKEAKLSDLALRPRETVKLSVRSTFYFSNAFCSPVNIPFIIMLNQESAHQSTHPLASVGLAPGHLLEVSAKFSVKLIRMTQNNTDPTLELLVQFATSHISPPLLSTRMVSHTSTPYSLRKFSQKSKSMKFLINLQSRQLDMKMLHFVYAKHSVTKYL